MQPSFGYRWQPLKARMLSNEAFLKGANRVIPTNSILPKEISLKHADVHKNFFQINMLAEET